MNLDLKRSCRQCTPAAARCEPLEARNLFAAYVEESIAEHFDLPGVLYDLSAPAGSIGFGAAGIGLGDVDGDGKGDFAISAIGSVDGDGATTAAGAVFAYSGATGSVIRTLGDTFADFGVSLAKVGDLDGDGVAELVVGSPRFDSDSDTAIDPTGAAYVYSGATGALLRTFLGTQANSAFGHVVGAAGLADGDALPDVMVGAPNDGPENQGRVYILSSAEAFVGLPGAEIIYTFTGEASGDLFGFAIAPADLQTTAEGVDPSPDYLIGAPGNDSGGAGYGIAYVYRHADGTQSLTIRGTNSDREFGFAVLAIKDPSGPVLLVGAPGGYHWFPPVGNDEHSGNVHSYSAAGVETTYENFEGSEANQRLGSALFLIGDCDDDGVADFAIQSGTGRPESARIVAAGSHTFGYRTVSMETGHAVFAAGDVDGDGVADVIEVYSDSGAVRVRSSLAVVPPTSITNTNDDLTFAFMNDSAGQVDRSGFAVIHGRYTSYRDIPGLQSLDVIDAVNNAGLIVGHKHVVHTDGTVDTSEKFIIESGVRRLLPDAVTQVVGDETPDYTSMQFVRLANDGSIALNDSQHGISLLFKAGILTFLWDGSVIDLNDSGLLLGSTQTEYVLRSSTGEITPLSGFTPQALNDSGVVAGVDPQMRIVTWSAGSLALVGDVSHTGVPSGIVTVLDFCNSGTVLYVSYAERRSPLDPPAAPFYGVYTPGHGMSFLEGGVLYANPQGPRRLAMDGQIVVRVEQLLRASPQDPHAVFSAGSPVSRTLTTQGSVVVGLNDFDEIVIQTDSAGFWRSFRWTIHDWSQSGEIHVDNLIAYTDPRSGHAFLIVFADNNGVYQREITEQQMVDIGNGNLLDTGEGPRPSIIANEEVFITTDTRAVLAGTSADGLLLIYFQTGQVDTNGDSLWSWNDLTRDHVEAGGQSFVPVAGGLAAFSTRWGAMNIVYLDAAGSVQAVWWAPGMDLWRTDNLSESANAPPIHGGLKAFTTSWDAMNIIGTDDNGRPVAIWWVPGMDGWQYDPQLTSERETPGLDPSSLVVFTTPWNAMNIIGRDAGTGRTIAYWWAPGMIDWRVDELLIPSRPEGVVTTGELAGGMAANTQAIFGREASTGHLIELFWMPGQTDWDIADITDLVA